MDHRVKDFNEEEKDNVLSFEVLQGGKPPTGETGDWLSDIEVGTIFLTQEKGSKAFHLDQWHMIAKSDRSFLLVSNLNGTVKLFVARPAFRFCNKYDLHEILGIIREEPKEEDEASE